MSKVISVDPNIQGGTPCFAGTRVPVASLFDYLAGGQTVQHFLEQFPTVTAAQANAVLEEAKQNATDSASKSA